MLLLQFLLLGLLFLASYAYFEGDIFAPPSVVSLGFSFATLCCLYNEKTWELDYSANTMLTILIGVAAFVIGSIIAVLMIGIFQAGNTGLLYNRGLSHKISNVGPIKVQKSKTFLIIFFELFTIVLLYSELRTLTGKTKWFEIVSAYRAQEAYVNPAEFSMKISGMCSYAIEFSFAFALIYAYILGNNIAAKARQPIINWLPVVLSCVLSFMQGYRSDLIRLWVAVLVVTYTLKKRKAGWKNDRETRKMIRVIALSVVGVAAAFVALRWLVGRSETDWNPIYYLTFYAGSPIAAFDLYLKDPLPASDIWGKETFYHLNQSIGEWFNKPELRYIFYKEYRQSPSGIYIGNVYTALRPFYYDFGFSGMVLMMLLMGMLFTAFYCIIRETRGNSKIDFSLLIYSYIAYTFFMYFYNCYNTFICFWFIKFIVELYVFRWFLVGNRFHKIVTIRNTQSFTNR